MTTAQRIPDKIQLEDNKTAGDLSFNISDIGDRCVISLVIPSSLGVSSALQLCIVVSTNNYTIFICNSFLSRTVHVRAANSNENRRRVEFRVLQICAD